MTVEHWRGIGKLIEECGEVQQLLGKAIPFPVQDHPDGKGPLKPRLREELTDLWAAMQYFMESNDLTFDRERFARKVELFRKWGLTGVVELNAKAYSKD